MVYRHLSHSVGCLLTFLIMPFDEILVPSPASELQFNPGTTYPLLERIPQWSWPPTRLLLLETSAALGSTFWPIGYKSRGVPMNPHRLDSSWELLTEFRSSLFLWLQRMQIGNIQIKRSLGGATWSFVPSPVELVCHSSWLISVFTSQVASLSIECPQFYFGSWRSPVPHFVTDFVMKGCWVLSVSFPHQLRWCSSNMVYHIDWLSYIEPPLYSGINP